CGDAQLLHEGWDASDQVRPASGGSIRTSGHDRLECHLRSGQTGIDEAAVKPQAHSLLDPCTRQWLREPAKELFPQRRLRGRPVVVQIWLLHGDNANPAAAWRSAAVGSLRCMRMRRPTTASNCSLTPSSVWTSPTTSSTLVAPAARSRAVWTA